MSAQDAEVTKVVSAGAAAPAEPAPAPVAAPAEEAASVVPAPEAPAHAATAAAAAEPAPAPVPAEPAAAEAPAEPASPTQGTAVLKRPSTSTQPQPQMTDVAPAAGSEAAGSEADGARPMSVDSASMNGAGLTAEAALAQAMAPKVKGAEGVDEQPPAASQGPEQGPAFAPGPRGSRDSMASDSSRARTTTDGSDDMESQTSWVGPKGSLSADPNVAFVDTLPATDHITGTLDEIAEGIMKDIDLAVDGDKIRIIGFRGEDDLNDYTIFRQIAIERKAALIKLAAKDLALNRAMGSMCGMGVGDALGHPFEFLPTQDAPTKHSPHFDLKTLRFIEESNAFFLDRGQWTDDAAMGLCMADSFICRRQFDGSDMRVRFWCWWNRGYNNAFRNDPRRTSSVGLGGNISKSLMALTRTRPGQKIDPKYAATTEDAGNGSLMRFTPVSIFLHSADWETIYQAARDSSYTTHPGIIAAEACSFLAHLIVSALRLPAGADGKAAPPDNIPEWLEKTAAEYMETSGLKDKSGWGYDQMKWLVNSSPVNMTERCWNWKADNLDIAGTLQARGHRYNGYPVSSGYFGAYSLDGLAMALWSVYHTKTFDEAVTRSVNLLGDADSHGSITGQLAGALYGFDAIHPQFMKWLSKWDDHEFAVRAVLLHKIGATATAVAANQQ